MSAYGMDYGDYGRDEPETWTNNNEITEEEVRDNYLFDLSSDQESSYKWKDLMWGAMYTWTLVLGVKIYYAYPWMIDNDAFWKQACPSSAVSASVTGSKTYESGEIFAQWKTGWSNQKCKDAFPITNWTTESWLVMIVSAFGWLLWAVNQIWGNNGGILHMLQLRWTEIYLWFPVVYMWLAQNINNKSEPASKVILSWRNAAETDVGTNTTLLQWQQ